MKLYFESTRNGLTVYTSFDGMDEETVNGLMAEMGHTDIVTMTEEDFKAAVAALEL